MARFARIYPTYILGLLLALLPFLSDLRAIGRMTVAVIGGMTLSLLQAWVPFGRVAWNAPAWSLSVEAFFYLLFPWLAIVVGRFSVRRLIMLLAAIWVGYAVIVGLAITRFPSGILHTATGLNPQWARVFVFNPYIRLPEFVAGIALASLITQLGPSSKLARRLAPIGVLAVVSLACVVAAGPLQWNMLTYVTFDPLFVILLLSLAWDGSLLGRLLGWGPFVLLGEASYALYIIHYPLSWWFVSFTQLKGWAFFSLYVAATILLSVVLFLAIERPARSLIRDWWRERRQRIVLARVSVAS